jgi:nucleotide-binding universal stress UspA family protein
MYRKILVGLDGSEHSLLALERAVALAKDSGAEVNVLSIEEGLPAYAATVGESDAEREYKERYYREIQEEARRRVAEHGVPLRMEVLPGHPAEMLMRWAAERAADLIVIGRTGHSRLQEFFLGSTTDRVVDRAPCDVLVVGGPAGDGSRTG